MIRAVILENEAVAKDTLIHLLKDYCPEVEVLGSAVHVDEARDLILQVSPALVFMDIELDHGTSLSLFDYFPKPLFNVIFTTAYDKYAVQAIKASCLDYLLKPIDFRELQRAIDKHIQKTLVEEQAERLQNLIHNLHHPVVRRLAIPLQDGYVFCGINEIVMCAANGNYTHLHTLHQGKLLSSRTLGEFESMLPASQFFRSHKSYLINLDQVIKYIRTENQIVLKNDLRAELALRRKESFFSSMLNKDIKTTP